MDGPFKRPHWELPWPEPKVQAFDSLGDPAGGTEVARGGSSKDSIGLAEWRAQPLTSPSGASGWTAL